MSAAEKIRPEDMAITAQECGDLWGITPEHFLRVYACLPTFPERIQRKPAVWIAGEVLEWRRNHRAQKRRRG